MFTDSGTGQFQLYCDIDVYFIITLEYPIGYVGKVFFGKLF